MNLNGVLVPQTQTTYTGDPPISGYQSNIYDNGFNSYWHWYPSYPTTIEVEPTKCMGKAHVFECDHVTACQCGKITRVMPKPAKEKKR